jgi:putative toxin-antitoxin system antitoxin component (TIGR02293 family)
MKGHEYRKHIDKSKFKLSTKAKIDLMRKFEIGDGTKVKSQAKADAAVIERILLRATEVIGNRQKAMRWLGTPVRGLGFATPISLLGTEVGKEQVTDILGQMEHGIW